MKGFIQIPLLILLLIGTGASVYLIQQKTHFLPQAFSGKEILNIFSDQPIATGSSTQISTYKLPASAPTKQSNTHFLSAFQRILQRTLNQSPAPTVPTPPAKINALPTPASSAKPIATPAPITPLVTNSSVKNSTCDINVWAKPENPNSYFDNPLTLQLFYAATYSGSKYVTGAKWDFNGDGSWDTDMSLSNGSTAHTFPGNGNYTVKLQLQMSDGEITPTCSKTITVPMGVVIRLTGQVYNDTNCNNTKENNETGFADMGINIINPGGLVYETVASDNSGNYTFSKILPLDQSLTLHPSPSDPSIVFQSSTVTINQNNPIANIDISYCHPSNPTPTPTPIAAQSCSGVVVEGATFTQTYQGQNGTYYQYSINSGATAKLTAQTTPAGGYVRWTKGSSINLPNDGTFTYPDSNNTSIVNWTAPNNPVSTEEGVDVRGDISEYPNTWEYCPTITFAVKPG